MSITDNFSHNAESRMATSKIGFSGALPPRQGSVTFDCECIGMWTSATLGYTSVALPWWLDFDNAYTIEVLSAYIETVGLISSGLSPQYKSANTVRVRIDTSGKTANRPFVGSVKFRITKN